MTEANPAPAPDTPEAANTWLGRGQLVRLLLGGGTLVCFLIFWWAGKLMGIPAGDSGSLLQTSPLSLLSMLVLLLGCTAVGSAIAGTVRPDAGLFCATIGLAALSLRDGSIRDALHRASSPAILLALAAELIVLYIFIIACWMVVRHLLSRGLLQGDAARDGLADHTPRAGGGKPHPGPALGQKLSAASAQVAVMFVVVLLLAPYDAKNQVLAAVGIGAWAGTVLSHYFLHPVRPSAWYLAGPLVVGVVGYLITYFNALGTGFNPAGWQTANLQGSFAALARPLPLDYASVGVAGALLGYWMSRRWRKQLQA